MSHVCIKLYPGRSERDKAELARAITKDVVAILECGEDSVSVAIEDVPSSDWVEKVFKPEIAAKSDTLFKKPGYDPLRGSLTGREQLLRSTLSTADPFAHAVGSQDRPTTMST